MILQCEVMPDTGCIEWRGINGGRAGPNGYSSIEFEGKSRYVHIAAWLLFNGEIPDGICVLHKCDNRSCFNVDHLYLGTKKQNRKDFMERYPGARLLVEKARVKAVASVKNFWDRMSDDERKSFCKERAKKQAAKRAERRIGAGV